MIEHSGGDILKATTDAIVNPVNCVGVMGAGLAKQFKDAYPDMFLMYSHFCEQKELQLGRLHVYPIPTMTQPKWIVNLPSKYHWKDKSNLEMVIKGIITLANWVRTNDVKSVSIPPIGCGLGGLDWDTLTPHIVKAFIIVPEINITLYIPRQTQT